MKTELPEILAVRPFSGPASGAAAVPGSKSLTNRALLLGALAEGPTRLTGALLSEDTEIMAEALVRLGFRVDVDPPSREIHIEGRSGDIPAETADLFTGLAGTAARFLTALCCTAKRGTYRLDGTAQMRTRPMRGLIEALRTLGADIRCLGEEGHFPLEVRARGLAGGAVDIDARESSQMLSALLMVSPLASQEVAVTPAGGVRMPFVRMTTRQMAQFGVPVTDAAGPGSAIRVPVGRYRSPGTYAVEPDATAASYFAALPLAVGGTVALPGVLPAAESLQGDVRFLEVLARCGAVVSSGASGIQVSRGEGPLRGGDFDFSGHSDTFLTLAAIAPLLEGRTRICGIAHTRRQETDRVSGMAGELRRLGQEVVETEDSIEVNPAPLRRGVTVETHGDHRFAMSFGILGSRDVAGDGRPWLSIGDPGCCAKTFPAFFDVLEHVRAGSSASGRP